MCIDNFFVQFCQLASARTICLAICGAPSSVPVRQWGRSCHPAFCSHCLSARPETMHRDITTTPKKAPTKSAATTQPQPTMFYLLTIAVEARTSGNTCIQYLGCCMAPCHCICQPLSRPVHHRLHPLDHTNGSRAGRAVATLLSQPKLRFVHEHLSQFPAGY